MTEPETLLNTGFVPSLGLIKSEMPDVTSYVNFTAVLITRSLNTTWQAPYTATGITLKAGPAIPSNLTPTGCTSTISLTPLTRKPNLLMYVKITEASYLPQIDKWPAELSSRPNFHLQLLI